MQVGERHAQNGVARPGHAGGEPLHQQSGPAQQRQHHGGGDHEPGGEQPIRRAPHGKRHQQRACAKDDGKHPCAGAAHALDARPKQPRGGNAPGLLQRPQGEDDGGQHAIGSPQ
ncbi:hypothetical protein [Pedomonas mirosovicensis]|uniref:hypothetical protein n=1 Tax=Pedomonas mirosovicensis TaxID=2908641 RepID=UPI0021682F6B|nr:hypothetical protein [Pedomonas mirosovicensis]MCH8685071.1 hypothetical protein [Pedomonas mirosovicensis]